MSNENEHCSEIDDYSAALTPEEKVELAVAESHVDAKSREVMRR